MVPTVDFQLDVSDFEIGRVRFANWTCPIVKPDLSDFDYKFTKT